MTTYGNINIPILVIAIMYAIIMNNYFGNNWSPESDAEIICDGIGFMIFAMVFLK